jgi:hypothetical protein
MTGMLSICCIAEHKVGGREAMLSKCHDGYKKQGFDLSNLKIEKSDDFLQFTNVIKGQVDIQKETKPQKQTKDNITFYLAKKGNNWVYMEMFGPAKTSDFEAWALNDRALEIIKDKMITI